MNDQKLMLDLSDLAGERIEVVPADSLDSATYGHGMPELAASLSRLRRRPQSIPAGGLGLG